MKVIDRNGQEKEFDRNRIYNAVKTAFKVTKKEISEDELNEFVDSVFIYDRIPVEEIQDEVEELLMDSGYNSVAKEYILYRRDREIIRQHNNKFKNQIKSKLNASNIVNQNANVDELSFGGRIGEAGRVVTKDAALEMMSELSKNNHLDNMIYIHDLDSYVAGEHNCLTLPLDDLLERGAIIKGRTLRPAGSVSSACQLTAVYFQIQSLEQFGGVAANHYDWTLIPYVRKSFFKYFSDYIQLIENTWEGYEKCSDYINNYKTYPIKNLKEIIPEKVYNYALTLVKKEIHQGIEALYHNLNTLLSRSGNQLPFSSINYGTCTLLEGQLVIEELLNCSIEGIGIHHNTSIFPCGIFQYMKGINDKPGTPNYYLKRLALKSVAKRIYPNFVNVDWSVNEGYDRNDPRTYTATMGCRTYNGFDINGFGQLKDGRGNICPVTIIMPTLAMMAKEDCKNVNEDIYQTSLIESFMEILETKLYEAKDMLIERFEWICSQSPDSAKFMYKNNTMYGYKPEEGIRSALIHGTLAIGQIGLAETLQILINCDHTTEKGMILAKRIEKLFKNKCKEFKEHYKLNFGVYMTPAENLCYTSMKKFKEKYGIITNVSDREYFTNSIHVPVWHKCTPFEKIDIEAQLTGYSNAGCITYVELPSTVNNNLDALEQLVDYAMNKDIPYFAINIPVDDCQICGASGEFGETCPECGSKDIMRLRRVTGYLSADYHNFNYGKQKEVEERVKHC